MLKKILNVFSDGQAHSVSEMADRLQQSPEMIQTSVEYLAQEGYLEKSNKHMMEKQFDFSKENDCEIDKTVFSVWKQTQMMK